MFDELDVNLRTEVDHKRFPLKTSMMNNLSFYYFHHLTWDCVEQQGYIYSSILMDKETHTWW